MTAVKSHTGHYKVRLHSDVAQLQAVDNFHFLLHHLHNTERYMYSVQCASGLCRCLRQRENSWSKHPIPSLSTVHVSEFSWLSQGGVAGKTLGGWQLLRTLDKRRLVSRSGRLRLGCGFTYKLPISCNVFVLESSVEVLWTTVWPFSCVRHNSPLPFFCNISYCALLIITDSLQYNVATVHAIWHISSTELQVRSYKYGVTSTELQQ